MASRISVRLGKRVRAIRKAKGWRLIDLAQHSGVKEVHLSYVERGMRDVGFNVLVAIAKGLEVKLSDLIRDVEYDVRIDTCRSQKSGKPCGSVVSLRAWLDEIHTYRKTFQKLWLFRTAYRSWFQISLSGRKRRMAYYGYQ